MRILDKYVDFYDYLQYSYKDDSVTFDRRGSEILPKDTILNMLTYQSGKSYVGYIDPLLLQVGNRFWLCIAEVTKVDNELSPVDYELTCLVHWNNYNKPRRLLALSVPVFDWKIFRLIEPPRLTESIKERYKKYTESTLVPAINSNDYKVEPIFIQPTHKKDAVDWRFPILKEAKFGSCIEPLDIFLAIEEYFMLEKQDAERTESTGITDKEKIENHGFDTKISFRGKR